MSGLKVYDADGLSVFKNFLFISQMFVVPSLIVANKIDLGFVPFLILCRDRNLQLLVSIGKFFVATDENFFATSNVMFKFTYVTTMRNIIATETFLAISESKVDYVAT